MRGRWRLFVVLWRAERGERRALGDERIVK